MNKIAVGGLLALALLTGVAVFAAAADMNEEENTEDLSTEELIEEQDMEAEDGEDTEECESYGTRPHRPIHRGPKGRRIHQNFTDDLNLTELREKINNWTFEGGRFNLSEIRERWENRTAERVFPNIMELRERFENRTSHRNRTERHDDNTCPHFGEDNENPGDRENKGMRRGMRSRRSRR